MYIVYAFYGVPCMCNINVLGFFWSKFIIYIKKTQKTCLTLIGKFKV